MISVVVPTFNRPDGLRRAARSLFAQTLVAKGFTIVVVDNTPEATASEIVAELRRDCPPNLTLITLHEPSPGVANARNRAMRAVETDLVAFLDDDQSAPSGWLEALLASHARHPAAVTFAPVRTALPDALQRHRAYFSAFFAREPDHASGYIRESYGCGNALVDFSKIPGGAPWFDPAMNEMGGEDDVLFARARSAGEQFAWAEEAPVWEHPPADRLTLRYTLRRAFSYGQSPITMALKQNPKRFDLVLIWSMIGIAKGFWHGAQWLALSLVRHPGRAFQLDLAIRGFSKLFWGIDLKFYGAAAYRRSTAKREQTPLGQAPRSEHA